MTLMLSVFASAQVFNFRCPEPSPTEPTSEEILATASVNFILEEGGEHWYQGRAGLNTHVNFIPYNATARITGGVPREGYLSDSGLSFTYDRRAGFTVSVTVVLDTASRTIGYTQAGIDGLVDPAIAEARANDNPDTYGDWTDWDPSFGLQTESFTQTRSRTIDFNGIEDESPLDPVSETRPITVTGTASNTFAYAWSRDGSAPSGMGPQITNDDEAEAWIQARIDSGTFRVGSTIVYSRMGSSFTDYVFEGGDREYGYRSAIITSSEEVRGTIVVSAPVVEDDPVDPVDPVDPPTPENAPEATFENSGCALTVTSGAVNIQTSDVEVNISNIQGFTLNTNADGDVTHILNWHVNMNVSVNGQYRVRVRNVDENASPRTISSLGVGVNNNGLLNRNTLPSDHGSRLDLNQCVPTGSYNLEVVRLLDTGNVIVYSRALTINN